MKPRIRQVNYVWYCYGQGYTGLGYTPDVAYYSWLYGINNKRMGIK